MKSMQKNLHSMVIERFNHLFAQESKPPQVVIQTLMGASYALTTYRLTHYDGILDYILPA